MDDNREEHSIMTLRKRIREEVPRRDRNPTLIRGSDQAAMGGSRDRGEIVQSGLQLLEAVEAGEQE